MADLRPYEGIVAYSKDILISFAQNAKVAIFNKPEKILTIKGKQTVIRESEVSGASDYTGAWGDGVGTVSLRQRAYDAPYDRTFSANIDSVKEAQSFIEGAKPSLVGAAEEFIKKQLAPEVDTVCISRMASQVVSDNVHVNSASGYGITVDTILATLTNIAKDISNAGYDGEIVTFISATANANLEQALLAKNILMNEVVIKREMTREEIAEGWEPLTIEFRCRKFNNLLVIPVPDNRMYGKVLMLDGFSEGQEDGGVLPMKNSSSYFDINILAIPFDAAYANIRHIVSNMSVPNGVPLEDYSENINLVNEKLFGVMTLENIGISQLSDGFHWNTRTIYGADIFNKYRDCCVLVKGATGAVTVAPTTAECVSPASALSGADGATSDIKFVFGPLNCSGTVYFTSGTTAKATVDSSETITVPTEGDDLRPYATPTVTFDAAGDSVITAWADSNHTIKLGAVTVTSTG